MINGLTRKIYLSFSLFIVATTANADLIENGGFEDRQLTANCWGLFESIPGWYMSDDGGPIEVQNRVAGPAYEGNQHVELDSTQPSAIFQNVETVADQSYTLSFAFAARPHTSKKGDNVMGVWWGDTNIFEEVAPDYTPNWTVFSLNVVASSDLTTLSFRDVSPNYKNSYGVYLDDVKLTAKPTSVPEPSTLFLLGAGLMGLGLSRRRRQA